MRDFGDLEAEIMNLLWERDGQATVREIHDELYPSRRLAYTTVMTAMDNLFKKGWLRRELAGRAYLYAPVSARAEYSAGLMKQALSDSNDQVAAFAHFLRGMSADERRALQDAYREVAAEHDGSTDAGRRSQRRTGG